MIVSGFYKLLSMLDYYVYKLASTMISVNIDIAGKEIFRPEQINNIVNRVYIVIGVLMLFKIVISAIQYMVNPDTFDDKEKGLGGLLKKTVISITLIAVCPAIFDFLIAIQSSVVETIPKIVFGSENVDNSQSAGDNMSFVVLSSFISPNDKSVSVGQGKENGINNLEDFKTKAADGCGGGIVGDAKSCKYNYMIIISTLSGGFLCYVLMSMTLDVAIRTIKFSLIRVLAPIPISSYVFSKDRLNKFVKTTMTVYFDLFIRLAIIYFIIFAVKEVIDSKMLENIAGNDDWFRNAIVNIAIIGGLFMFAKTAPKFITELLGLPDVGSGDMKDMFTRGAGLAGTALAGFRTARSNYTAQKERALGKNPDGKVGARLRGALSAAAGFGSATGRGLAMTAQGKGFKDVRQGANKAAINARNRRIDRADKLYNTGVERRQFKTDELGNRVERKLFGKIGHLNTSSKLGKYLDKKLDLVRYKTQSNPEYYGYMDYRRDVSREKLGIPSSEGFIKARYDAMEGIAKMASDAKGHGVGKMNETPDKYKINLSTEAGDPGKSIMGSLGFNELTMEQVRNMYQMAKNGQEITTENRDASGNRIVRKLTDNEITILGSLVQNVEKRTSYLKEAELMATGDPAATPNAEKLRIGIQTNKDMFSSPDIIGPIRAKLLKDIGNSITINGKTIDISKLDYNGLVNITSHLQHKIDAPAGSDEYNATVKERANILLGLKDAFEEVSKLQYRGAQIADNRAQKAQQAISNNDKKS